MAESHDKEHALQEAELFRLLIHGAIDYAIFMLDVEGRVVSWNMGAERLKGYRADEIIGKHFSIFYPREAIDRDWPGHELKVAAQEGRFEDEGWRLRQDGSRFWANVVITAMRDAEGKLRGFSKITRDMTERMRAEENARRLLKEEVARQTAEKMADDLRQSERRFSRFMQQLPGLAWIKDREGRYVYANDAAVNAFQVAREKLYGMTDAELFPKTTAADFRANDHRAIDSAAGVQVIETLTQSDGVVHSSLVSKFPIPDAAGQVAFVGGMAIDVTEQRQTARALEESEERLRLALDAGRMGVWDWNIRTNELKWSPSLEPLHGLAPGTFEGTFDAFQRLIHPADRARVQAAIEEAIAKRTDYEVEFRNLRPNGGVHWIAGKGLVFTDEKGEPERMIGVGMDVTQQTRAAQNARFLASASATLASLVDFNSTLQKVASLAVPYFADWAAIDVFESDGALRRVAVAHVDPAKVALAQELHRRHPPDPSSPHGAWNMLRTGEAEWVREITDEMLAKTTQDADLLAVIRELGLKSYIGVPLKVRDRILGVVTFISAESGHLYDESDLAVAQDVAHRGAVAIENSLLYRELKEADRRKDEFLATLAHELRNPLAPIRNSLQILRMPRIGEEVVRQTTEMMERQVHHLVRLVDDLLDVSRVMRGKIELRRESIELASIVARAVETAQPLIDAQGHSLEISVPRESMLLYVDPVRVAQIVGNLLTNAAKYTQANGRIWLSATTEGPQAVLRVRDTGIGIDPALLPHVFDLFVQADHSFAKAQGGLGIGLTLVKNLVEMHGGAVVARSEGLGKGSEFVVRLPLATPPPTTEEAIGESAKSPGARLGHRVLVVDDNRDAATSLSMLLKLHGHDVCTAFDGRKSLAIAAELRPAIVFLDIGMPGMDGYEVARRLRTIPGLEDVVLVALTGWGQAEDRRRTDEAGFNHHLVKPPEPNVIDGLLATLDKS
jgi:PAS domain S-box-containing protein